MKRCWLCKEPRHGRVCWNTSDAPSFRHIGPNPDIPMENGPSDIHPLLQEAESHRSAARYDQAFDCYHLYHQDMGGKVPMAVVEHLFSHAVLSGRNEAVERAFAIRCEALKAAGSGSILPILEDLRLMVDHGFHTIAIRETERLLDTYPDELQLRIILATAHLRRGDVDKGSDVMQNLAKK